MREDTIADALATASAARQLFPRRGGVFGSAAAILGALLLASMLVRVLGADHQTPRGASPAGNVPPAVSSTAPALAVEAGRSTPARQRDAVIAPAPYAGARSQEVELEAMNNFRQGDVPLVPYQGTLDGYDLVPCIDGKVILAAGTATGHHHRIEGCGSSGDLATDGARLFRHPQTGAQLLEVGPRGATLVHEEHDPIPLPPGRYQQLVQVEDTGEMISQVFD